MLGAPFRWLSVKHYVSANPFSGVRVRGTRAAGLDTTRVFSVGERHLPCTVANGLESLNGLHAVALLHEPVDEAPADGRVVHGVVAAEDGRCPAWLAQP